MPQQLPQHDTWPGENLMTGPRVARRPNPRPSRARVSDRHPSRRASAVVLALVALLIGGALLAGCGGSSKPAYCDPVTKVENAIKSLPTVQDVKNNGVGTLTSALSTLQQKAATAVNQAKSDFSSQTTALKNSVDALSSTVKQLTGTPSAQTLALLTAQLSAVGTAAKNLQSAVSSKCG
jgi:predicted PurR-regulated permease PerM